MELESPYLYPVETILICKPQDQIQYICIIDSPYKNYDRKAHECTYQRGNDPHCIVAGGIHHRLQTQICHHVIFIHDTVARSH